MKKLISILLIFVMLLAGVPLAFATDLDGTLEAIGISPDMLGSDTELITRQEFSYMTARLLGGEREPLNTIFTDVDETNVYSGYIAYLASNGVISGDGEGKFNPLKNASYAMAAKLLIKVLGYDELAEAYGGYPTGYEKLMSQLKLNSGVALSSGESITVEAAKRLILNALTVNKGSARYNSSGSTILNGTDKNGGTILAEQFGISVYEGTVNSVNSAGTGITVEISKNKYDTNPKEILKGSTVSFVFAAKGMAKEYLYVPSVLYVNGDNEIVYIEPQRGVEVKYGSISGINRTEKNYPIYNIDEIELLNDDNEYTVRDNAILHYNGVNTRKTVPLYDKFAKLVVKNDEVLFIESWDLTDGGLITKADGNNITYIKDGKTNYLKDLSAEKSVNVIIGRRNAYLNEIKADSLFQYYKNDDMVVIVVSEKKVADIFYGVSSSDVSIGDALYDKADKVYYSDDGVNYDEKDYKSLLNRNVTAYISPNGYVWFIKALDESGSDCLRTKLYGIVKGLETERFDPDFAQLKVIETTDELSERTLRLTDKTVYNDGLSMQELTDNARSLQGEGIYIFEITGERVISVSKPTPVYGYSKTDIDYSYFGDMTALVALTPHYLMFSNTQPILTVYEKNGEFTAGWTNWVSLYDHQASMPIKMRFFGEDKNSVPTLVVMASGAGELSQLGSAERYGVIADVSNVYGENEEERVKISVIMKDGKKDYVITSQYAHENNISKHQLIRFRDDAKYSDSEIIFLSNDSNLSEKYIYSLSGDAYNWQLPTTWKKGVVDTADSSRVVIWGENSEPNSILFHPYDNFIAVYNTDKSKPKFTLGTWSDIEPGNTVYCNCVGDGTRGIIVVK